MSNLKFISWNEDKKYSLVSGGLIYGVMKKIDLLQKGESRLIKRALLMAALTWLPLALLTLLNGTFAGQEVSLPFIEDFLLHTRLLVVIPFLVMMEKIIDPLYDDYINSTRRVVDQNQESEFANITNKVDRWSMSWIPEIFFILLIYIFYLISWDDLNMSVSRWSEGKDASGINFALIYYLFISIPVYQLLLARWLWRWIIWSYSLIKFSQLDMKIEASHADQMAGMEHMRLVPMAFSLLGLAMATIFSATIAEEILYDGAQLEEYYYPILFFAVITPLVIHAPMVALIPLMARTKARAMNRFSSLIQYHNNLYREKWMEDEMPDGENILGSLDNSSMADINGSYQQAVKEMNLIPVTHKNLISIMIALLLPFTPLLLTLYSIKDLIEKLLKVVSG